VGWPESDSLRGGRVKVEDEGRGGVGWGEQGGRGGKGNREGDRPNGGGKREQVADKSAVGLKSKGGYVRCGGNREVVEGRRKGSGEGGCRGDGAGLADSESG